MSIESDLSSIAKSLALIADLLTVKTAHTATAATAVSAPVAAPVVEAVPAPKPAVVETPVQPAPIPTAPVMSTVITATAAPATASPSSITKEQFMSTIMEVYKALGPVKGAGIQQVLSAHGAVNINDIKPEQYAAVLAQVKAL